jgi:hypothetical protein
MLQRACVLLKFYCTQDKLVQETNEHTTTNAKKQTFAWANSKADIRNVTAASGLGTLFGARVT